MISQEGLIDPREPFRNGLSALLEIPPGEASSNGDVPGFVSDLKLDLGRSVGLENSQTGADRSRFFDKQSKGITQWDRFDSDLDPGLGVPISQQSPDRGRLALDLDPTPPNARLSGAVPDLAAQGRNLEAVPGIEEPWNRMPLLIMDFNHYRRCLVRIDIAQHELDGPTSPNHVVGKVQGRLHRFFHLLLDSGNCRERMIPRLPKPQPDWRERRTILGIQKQEASKVFQELLIDLLEPFRDGSCPLLEISPDEVPSNRVLSCLVPDLKCDFRRSVRLENGQTGADRSRFFDKKSKGITQWDRFDSDLDPGLGVPISQQSSDRGRLDLDLDPTPPNASLASAMHDPTAQGRNLKGGLRIEEPRNRTAFLIEDFNFN